MGYIIVIARLPGIYGNMNNPCPLASPSDSGRFTAINLGPCAIIIKYSLNTKLTMLHESYDLNFSRLMRIE